MSLPDYYKTEPGTPITWKASGGTYAITCTSLANGSARQGVKGDLGANWARRWKATLECKLNAAGTNLSEVEVYLSESTSATAGTDNDGGASGTDAALSNPSEVKHQMTPIGSIAVSNALGTGKQQQSWIFTPKSRYQSPAIVNNSGQAFTGTAADTILTLQPLEELIQETV